MKDTLKSIINDAVSNMINALDDKPAELPAIDIEHNFAERGFFQHYQIIPLFRQLLKK